MEYDYDAGGSLIVCGDYEGDLEAIAKVLTPLSLTQVRTEMSALWCATTGV
jgi:hypothetical protein